MPDTDHELNYPPNFWEKSPKSFCTCELESAFETAWKTPRTSEQEVVRLQMLVEELNSRTSRRYFWASTIIAIAALAASICALLKP